MNQFVIAGEIVPKTFEDFSNWMFERSEKDIINCPTVFISSVGGDIGIMLGIADGISNNNMKTTAVGLVQSAAAILLQAGIVRSMTKRSLLRFHAPEEVDGKIPEAVWALHSFMADILSQRTGVALIEAHDFFDNKFITPQRALELNLIDEIV